MNTRFVKDLDLSLCVAPQIRKHLWSHTREKISLQILSANMFCSTSLINRTISEGSIEIPLGK